MKKGIFLAIVSGLLLALPFSSYNLWIFAWFGFVPVFLALNNKSRKEAFFLFFIAGLVFWSTTIYWLIHVTLPGTILLIIYLALYPALFGLIICPSTRCSTPLALIFIPSVWVLFEYIRSYLFSGFGWALLGYSQYLNLPVIQIADITGVWGVSFLVIMVNYAVFSYIKEKKRYLAPLLVLVIALGYGYYKIYRPATSDQRPAIKVSIIQGNIPQELKWDPDPRVKYYVIDTYLTLSSRALKDNPALIIWPEASLPVVLEEGPSFSQAIGDFARQRKVAILTGAVTTRDNLYFNSAVLFSKEGELSGRYEKVHLVPFGEYIPLKNALPFLQAIVPIGEITPGEEYTVFMYNGQRFSVLICFEDLFPEIARRYAKNGAGFLVNITNDAWYKKTPAAYQHLQASVFRAVETRLSLVRAANTGVSGFIRPSGKIISPVSDETGREIFVQGYRTQPVFASEGALTLYTRYGDKFVLFCIISVLCGVVVSLFPSAPCVSPHR